jgi:hypothetical protein
MFVVGHHQSLVVTVHSDGEHPLGRLLANDVVIELGHDFTRRGDLGEQLLAATSTFAFLIENALAQLDAFAADINVAGAFD